MKRAATSASRMSPAASTMPSAMHQKMKTMSMGSFTGVRKRTMDRAPTMPSDSRTLLETARMTRVVMSVIATRPAPKLGEYMTPA